MNKKPKLTSKEIVQKMEEEKGITFSLFNKDQAEVYLLETNNYLRTASYRYNFEKAQGKYVNLEFEYLRELSTIDMYLRYVLNKMCIEVEHCLKVKFFLILRKVIMMDIPLFKVF